MSVTVIPFQQAPSGAARAASVIRAATLRAAAEGHPTPLRAALRANARLRRGLCDRWLREIVAEEAVR